MNLTPYLPCFLACHAGATVFMAGVIWFVQIIHYPLMAEVAAAAPLQFPSYEQLHCRLTTYVVLPPMLIEAAAAVLLLFCWPAEQPRWPAMAGLAAVVAIWLSTFVWQVPAHERLQQGFDLDTHRWLVASNWLRTTLWSARGAVAIWMLRAGG